MTIQTATFYVAIWTTARTGEEVIEFLDMYLLRCSMYPVSDGFDKRFKNEFGGVYKTGNYKPPGRQRAHWSLVM